MKTFQRWMGILLLAIAASSLVVACGDDETTCKADTDCGSGEICNFATETCGIECTSDQSLCDAATEVCTPLGAGNEGSICIVAAVDNNTNPECDAANPCADGLLCNAAGMCVAVTTGCTSNEECDVDGGQICDIPTGECKSTAVPTYLYAMISDVTDSCDNSADDPGVDIFAVSLTKGSDVYYGKVIGDNITNESGKHDDANSVLVGTPPALNAANCPKEGSGLLVSLGCGGDVVVEFWDASKRKIEIQSGDSISVYEYGGQCSSGDTETWQVALCDPDASSDDIMVDTSACNGTNVGAPSQAFSSVTVSL